MLGTFAGIAMLLLLLLLLLLADAAAMPTYLCNNGYGLKGVYNLLANSFKEFMSLEYFTSARTLKIQLVKLLSF